MDWEWGQRVGDGRVKLIDHMPSQSKHTPWCVVCVPSSSPREKISFLALLVYPGFGTQVQSLFLS